MKVMPTNLWIAPLITIALTQVAVISTSIYLHRALAHRALTVHPAMDVVFRAVLWLTTGQRRQQWVAVHRKHHAFTDRVFGRGWLGPSSGLASLCGVLGLWPGLLAGVGHAII